MRGITQHVKTAALQAAFRVSSGYKQWGTGFIVLYCMFIPPTVGRFRFSCKVWNTIKYTIKYVWMWLYLRRSSKSLSGVFLGTLLCILSCVQMFPVTGARTSTHTLSLYLVSCSQQVISHLVQVGGLACVDEAHHLFEDIWLHVIYLHTVLNGRRGQEGIHRGFNKIKGKRRKRQMLWQSFKTTRSSRVFFYFMWISQNLPELNSLTLFSTHTGTVSHAVIQNKFQVANKKRKNRRILWTVWTRFSKTTSTFI